MSKEFNLEIKIEKKLRAYPWIVPIACIVTAGLLFYGIYLCMLGFQQHYYWTIIPAGLMVHAFFIVTVHDGSHKAITRTKLDYLFMNLGASLMFLPFYGELFRKYHLIHHANTNSEIDPLWPDFKKSLYSKKRPLYILCELIPLAFTLILLLSGKKEYLKKSKRYVVKQPSVRIPYMVLSFLISVALAWWTSPPLAFIVGTLLSVNIFKLLRHWCEHMGTEKEKESNTYWFPLGMGIGNHEAHHKFPHFSWLTMMIGLYFRKTDTNPFKALYGILFIKSFSYYKKVRE